MGSKTVKICPIVLSARGLRAYLLNNRLKLVYILPAIHKGKSSLFDEVKTRTLPFYKFLSSFFLLHVWRCIRTP
jgi:hypothetical protein